MSTATTIVMAILTLAGGGGGIYALLTIPAQKKRLLAEADGTVAGTVKMLLESANTQVDTLQRRVSEATVEADNIRRLLIDVEKRAASLERRLQNLVGMIHDPYMTMDRLRVSVPLPTEPTPPEGIQ